MHRAPLPSEQAAFDAAARMNVILSDEGEVDFSRILGADLQERLVKLEKELEECIRLAGAEKCHLSVQVADSLPFLQMMVAPGPAQGMILTVCSYMLMRLFTLTRAMDRDFLRFNTELDLRAKIADTKRLIEQLMREVSAA